MSKTRLPVDRGISTIFVEVDDAEMIRELRAKGYTVTEPNPAPVDPMKDMGRLAELLNTLPQEVWDGVNEARLGNVKAGEFRVSGTWVESGTASWGFPHTALGILAEYVGSEVGAFVQKGTCGGYHWNDGRWVHGSAEYAIECYVACAKAIAERRGQS